MRRQAPTLEISPVIAQGPFCQTQTCHQTSLQDSPLGSVELDSPLELPDESSTTFRSRIDGNPFGASLWSRKQSLHLRARSSFSNPLQ